LQYTFSRDVFHLSQKQEWDSDQKNFEDVANEGVIHEETSLHLDLPEFEEIPLE